MKPEETARAIEQKYGDGNWSFELREEIARAILAAVEEEREACADLADKQGLWHISASNMSLPVEPSPVIAKDRAKVAFGIRDAIRNRS